MLKKIQGVNSLLLLGWTSILWHSVPPIYNLWPQVVCPPDITFIATSAKQRPVERASLGLCRCHTTTVLKLYALVPKGLGQLDFLSPHTQASEPAVNSQHCQVHHFYWTRQKLWPTSRWTPSHDPRSITGKAGMLVSHTSGGKIPTDSQALLVLPEEADTWCSWRWADRSYLKSQGTTWYCKVSQCVGRWAESLFVV